MRFLFYAGDRLVCGAFPRTCVRGFADNDGILTSFGIFVDLLCDDTGPMWPCLTLCDDKFRQSMLFVHWSNRITPEKASV